MRQLGVNIILVHAGSLESATPLAVSVNGGTFKEITGSSGTDFSLEGVSVRGEMAQGKPVEWGHDASHDKSTRAMLSFLPWPADCRMQVHGVCVRREGW